MMKKLNPNAGMFVPSMPSDRPMPPAGSTGYTPALSSTTPGAAGTNANGSNNNSASAPTTDDQLLIMFVHARSAFLEAVNSRSIAVTAMDSLAFERFMYRTFILAHTRDQLWITSTSAPIGSTIPQIQPFWQRFPLTHWTLAADIIAEVELQRPPRTPNFSASGDLAAENLSAYHQDRELLKGVYTTLATSLSQSLRVVLAFACTEQSTPVTRPQIDAYINTIMTIVYIGIRGSFVPKIGGPHDSVGHMYHTAAMQSMSALLDRVTSSSGSGGLMSIAALALPMMLLSRAHLPQLRMHAETALSIPQVGKQMSAKQKFCSGVPALICDVLALSPNVSIDQVQTHILRTDMFTSDSGNSSIVSATVNNWMSVVYGALSHPESNLTLVEPELAVGSLLDIVANKIFPKTMTAPPVVPAQQPPAKISVTVGGVSSTGIPAQPAMELRNGAFAPPVIPVVASTPVPRTSSPQPSSVAAFAEKSEFFTATMQATENWLGEDNAVHYALIAIATSDTEPSVLLRILFALRDAYSTTPSNFEPLFSIMTEVATSATLGGESGPDVSAPPRPALAIPPDVKEILHVLSVTLRSGNALHNRSIFIASQIVEQRMERLLVAHADEVSASSLTSAANFSSSKTGLLPGGGSTTAAPGDSGALWGNSGDDTATGVSTAPVGNIW